MFRTASRSELESRSWFPGGVEPSRQSRGRSERFGNWLMRETRTWLALAVATAACVLGLVIGALVASSFDVMWVGAAGTWLGAVATVGALVIARSIFQAEQQERRRDRELASARARQSTVVRQLDQQAQADLVTGRIGWGMGNGPYDHDGVPTMLARLVRLSVTNYATERATEVRVLWVYEDKSFRMTWDSVDAGASTTHEWRGDDAGVEVYLPENQAQAALAAEPALEVEFRMFGSQWRRVGAGPVQRLEDSV